MSGALFVGAGAAAWWSTTLLWMSCAGARTVFGSIVAAYVIEWSEACYQQMDGGGTLHWPDPVAASATATSVTLTGVAWLVLVVGLRWRLPVRLMAGGLGLLTLALGSSGLLPSPVPGVMLGEDAMYAVDVAALPAFVGIVWVYKSDRFAFARAAIALAAATTYGVVRGLLDYCAMVVISPANWDTPPGTGYLSAWFLVASGLSIIVLTALERFWRASASTPTLLEGAAVTHAS